MGREIFLGFFGLQIRPNGGHDLREDLTIFHGLYVAKKRKSNHTI